jgi:aspartate kinase
VLESLSCWATVKPAAVYLNERKKSMPVIVQKYGGSSVADPDRLRTVAQLIKARRDAGYNICVVVSAMGNTTDSLLGEAHRMHPNPPRRELDMLLTCGERVSMALLAMALDEIGVPSISFTGSQSGIMTDDAHSGARILEVRPFRVQDELKREKVVIVAGFQGVSYKKEITTLGRGGSDTTAVALAAALDAEACEIYSDVAGVYTADPRVVSNAKPIETLSYEEMQELATAGAKVLNAQAVQFAKAKGIAIYARKTAGNGEGSIVRRDAPKSPQGVRGIAHQERLYVLTCDSLDRLRQLISHLDAHGILSRHLSGFDIGSVDKQVTCLVSPDDAHGWEACIQHLPDGITQRDDVGAVSLVGDGLLDNTGLLERSWAAIDENQIAIHGVSTSSFRLTYFVSPDEVQSTTSILHGKLIEDA